MDGGEVYDVFISYSFGDSNWVKQNLFEPLNEFKFYEEYHRRLEEKLDHKQKQIARDELLLGTKSDEENQFIRASLHRSIGEREELIHLLGQVYKQLSKLKSPG